MIDFSSMATLLAAYSSGPDFISFWSKESSRLECNSVLCNLL